MKFYNDVLQLIGNTPLVKINRLTKQHGIKAQVFAKMESLNPSYSVKDRIGVSMINWAEREGVLKKGGTIIEATSGNTGIGLALTAAVRGYKCIFVLTDKVSVEKVRYLKSMGADVVVVPASAKPGTPEHYHETARRIAAQTPNSFYPDQYSHPANPAAHYRTTGPEVWEDTEGKVDIFVAGVGTGGTITGAGRFLRERKPGIHIVAVEPAESPVLSGGQPSPHKQQGIGAGFVPGNLDTKIYDEVIRVSNDDAIAT